MAISHAAPSTVESSASARQTRGERRGKRPMRSALCLSLLLIGGLTPQLVAAQSQQELQSEPQPELQPEPVDAEAVLDPAVDSAEAGYFLPTVLTPGGDRKTRAVVNALGGYDDGKNTGVMRLVGDVNVIGPLDLRLGLTYTPGIEDGELQPQGGARVRVLNQASHEIDLAVSLFYRMERFTDDEGFIQGLVSVGRRWGRLGVMGHFGYGQDPEGDDRVGDAALALLYTVAPAFMLGLESELKLDLLSDDPKREEREDSEFELTVGPIAQYSTGSIGLIAQAGVHTLNFENSSSTGAIVLGGVSYAQ